MPTVTDVIHTHPVLTLHNASYGMGHVDLLHQANVKLYAGEIVAIIGPNGAGKTTLLKALAGDIALTHGDVMLRDKNLHDWPMVERARQLAVLPQFSVLNFPYSVDEVVALGRIPHKTGITIDTEIVKQAMAAMDIEHLRDRNYMELSGGEKQRTQLARVMAQIWREHDAAHRVLLLDEPTMALDLGHQQQLMNAVRDFAAQGIAVAMVMHDINLMAQYADKLVALLCGRIVANGPVNDVISEKLLAQLFQAQVHVMSHPVTNNKVVL